jgi:hypothetical protein
MTTTTTTTNSTATTSSSCAKTTTTNDCPICLDPFTLSEQVVYPLLCSCCDYNFCNKCIFGFITASKDDFQYASDGSKQVKVSVSCPQCRGKYPMELHNIVLLRQAHALGCSLLRDGTLLGDSDLTATQLSWKRDFVGRQSTRIQLEHEQGLYMHVMKGRLDTSMMEQEEKVWKTLMEKLPMSDNNNDATYDDNEDDDDGNEYYYDDENEVEGVLVGSHLSMATTTTTTRKMMKKRRSPLKRKVQSIDDTLFQGLQDFMHRDEKIFLTELFTSGVVRNLAQAATIVQGVLRLSMTGKGCAIAKSYDEHPMSKYEFQKAADVLAKTKISFPLPAHMPGYFLIPAYSPRDGFMVLKDNDWDGSITAPLRSQRVFDTVYGEYYTPPQTSYPHRVVTINSVRGPVGRVGLRKGDVITHVNDVEWKGTAVELQEYIHDCCRNHSSEEISLTVNCNPETSKFLQVRHEMMIRSLEPKIQKV